MRIFAAVRCWWRGQHNSIRHPLGGFKCADCGVAGADFEEMGFEPGYVHPRRRLYTRTAYNGSMGQIGWTT